MKDLELEIQEKSLMIKQYLDSSKSINFD